MLSLLLLAIKTVSQGTVVFLRGVAGTIVGSLLFCAVDIVQYIFVVYILILFEILHLAIGSVPNTKNYWKLIRQ